MTQTRRSFLKSLAAGLIAVSLPDLEAIAETHKKITLPGIGNVDLNSPIIPNGHFSWKEATHNGERIPKDEIIIKNIIKSAKMMEEIRAYLGNNPIKVNSWYRNPEANAKVGGAKNSQHTRGRAVDFVVNGMNPSEVYKRLDSYWGARGGLGKYPNFTHIDNRGYRARW